MDRDLHYLPAFEVARRIRAREVRSVEVVEGCLRRISALDPAYGAYLTVTAEAALDEARRADAALQQGRLSGPLHGVPVSIKDTFLMRGTATTVGSGLLRAYSPERDDASCVNRLRDAGAVILGKVNVGSGMAPHLDESRIPPPRNPWNRDRTPGGSSSGSAVSVALGMAYGSVGTDLGGSIRNPAAYTGLVGLKPTYGRASQSGDVYGLVREYEHVGPITRTVRDAAVFLGVLAGHDPRDVTTVVRDVPDYVAALDRPRQAASLRIGWVADGGPAGADDEVLALAGRVVARLEADGASIERISLPSFPVEFWHSVLLIQEWENYDTGDLGLGGEAQPDRVYARFIESRFRERRRKVLDVLKRQLQEVRKSYGNLLQQFDLLALPTVPILPQPFGVRKVSWRGEERDVFDLQLSNLWMFNATGHPAISIPSGMTSAGLPAGIQFVGRHFEEDTLLAVAARVESAVGGFPLPGS